MITLLIHSSEHKEWMNLDIRANGFGTSHATLFNVEWWEEEDNPGVRGYFDPFVNVCRGDVVHYLDGVLSLVPDPGLWTPTSGGEWSKSGGSATVSR